MVETKLDIRFSADDTASVIVDSDASDEVTQQAELVSFGHYAARIILLLGRERALPLVRTLRTLEEASTDAVEGDLRPPEGIGGARVHVVPPDPSFPAHKAVQVVARFFDTRRGPRMFFGLKTSGPARRELEGVDQAAASVHVLLDSLLESRAGDSDYVRRLAATASLIGRLAANGKIVVGAEFDASLGAADVAWRLTQGPGRSEGGHDELQCPSCGNRGSTVPTSEAFDFRLWPSDRAGIRKCRRCGIGLWLRAGRRPRPIPRDLWRAMEAIRDDLTARGDSDATGSDDRPEATRPDDGALLEDLKRVFAANHWPYSEVKGAPVLLSELSGPLGSWKFYAQVVEPQSLILMYSICPLRVPDERRLEVSHFLSRANHGLAAGNFELDFEDGEIRYKTTLHIQGDEIDGVAVKRLVRANGLAMETYLPGIGAVITGMPAVLALERRTSL